MSSTFSGTPRCQSSFSSRPSSWRWIPPRVSASSRTANCARSVCRSPSGCWPRSPIMRGGTAASPPNSSARSRSSMSAGSSTSSPCWSSSWQASTSCAGRPRRCSAGWRLPRSPSISARSCSTNVRRSPVTSRCWRIETRLSGCSSTHPGSTWAAAGARWTCSAASGGPPAWRWSPSARPTWSRVSGSADTR